MAAKPELAPNENHLLKSSSVIRNIVYKPGSISFNTFNDRSEVVLRLVSEPSSLKVDGKPVEPKDSTDGKRWTWTPLEKGGVLVLKFSGGNSVEITF